MRNTRLKNGSRIVLVSEDKTKERTVTVERVLGEGANSIAYEVTEDSSGINFVMKECFPSMGAAREADGSVCWQDDEIESNAKERVRAAYEIQRTMQRDYAAQNTNAHLVDEIFTANNTLYTLVDAKNAKTYDKECDQNLRETFRTARSVAKAVKAYHDKGYLHLDIKPENVMLYPETRDMVMLMDFDSVVSMEALANGAIVTYSPPFAAPEQIQGRRRKLCPATDIYAIGAMTFARVMGRHPDASDRSMFSRWNYSESHYFNKVSEKCKRLTTEFFNKTICASIRSRVQTMDELIVMLDALIEESDPKRRYLISSCDEPTKNFVGRKNLLNKIKNAFAESNIVFLYGMGGIGKTELAKYYAKWARDEYDTVCLGKYQGSLEDMFTDAAFTVANSDKESAGFKEIKAIVDERTLLVIDGYDTDADRMFAAVSKLPCKILFTSRVDHSEMYENSVHIRVNEMSRRHQRELFEKECGGDIPQEQAERILNAIEGYTLLIPLIAKQYKKGLHTIEELADRICAAGIAESADSKVVHIRDGMPIKGNVYSILREILTIEKLDDEQKYVMGSLALLGDISVERTQLLEWIGKDYNDTLNELVESSWVLQSGVGPKANFSLHNVIQELMINELKPIVDEHKWVKKYIIDLFQQEIVPWINSGRGERIWRAVPFVVTNWEVKIIDGYDKANIMPKVRLAETIINNLSLENINNVRFIILAYRRLSSKRIVGIMNFASRAENLLNKIDSSKLEENYARELLYLRILLSFNKLLSVSTEERSSDSVVALVDKLKHQITDYEEFVEFTNYRYYLEYGRLIRQLVDAAAAMECGLFYTKWPEYDNNARTEYLNLLLRCLETIQKYATKQEEMTWAKKAVDNMRSALSPEGYSTYVHYIETGHMYETEAEEEHRKVLNGLFGEEFANYEYAKDMVAKILDICNEYGFCDEIIENGAEKTAIIENQKKARKAIKEAIRYAEEQGYDSYPGVRYKINMAICILESACGDYNSAEYSFLDYLHSIEGWMSYREIFNVLVCYNYTTAAKKLLCVFAENGESLYVNTCRLRNSSETDQQYNRWDFFERVIDIANIVNAPEIAAEYQQKQTELSSTGFTFKTE